MNIAQPNRLHKLFRLKALPACLLSLGVLALTAGDARALELSLGDDVQLKARGTVTLGTMIRTEAPDPAVLGPLATARVDAAAGQLGGNAGGADLNFQKGDPVSTVLKGVFDLDIGKKGFGLYLRGKAWTDQELAHGSRPYGNVPNGFAQNVPLSDAGFDPHAKFSNARLEDVNVYGKFDLAGNALELRVGRQVISWGTVLLTGGGLNVVNPVDLPGAQRPGATPDEIRIPVGMVSARLSLGQNWGVDGWVQYEFRHMVLPGCGTFFGSSNFAPTGCGYVSVLGGSGVNDPTALATGRYPKRNPDIEARDSGQYGISVAWKLPEMATELRAYLANYHSRAPSYRITNANVNGGYGSLGGSMSRLTDPNGIKYAMLFAEDIRMFGLSGTMAVSRTGRVYGELAYRPNQPLGFNPNDLVTAFLTRAPNTSLQLYRGTNAIPPGGSFDSYDRFKVATLTLGTAHAWPKLAGAERLSLVAEIGVSHVAGLPDPGTLRFGRTDDYGLAGVTGGAACVDTTFAQKSCALDGFITPNAWGVRMRLAATYPGVLGGATVTPSVMLAQDVSGYSFDGTFVEGRRTLRPAVRADWGNRYFAEVAYTRFSGGRYFNQIDRDNVAISGGIKF